jgi:hypothetical protein
MAYASTISPRMVVIDDDTPEQDLAPPDGFSTGLRLGLRRTPFGAIPAAPAFPKELVIPRADWPGLIEEKERTKTRLRDLAAAAGLPCKDQDGIPYCWIYAPTYCVELIRVVANHAMVPLSAMSAGARIKDFRQVGGWGEEGLSFIVEHGLVPEENWPGHSLDRRLLNPENVALARKYRVTEWYELRPRDLDDLISAVLRNIPVAVGYNWWGHEVTATGAAWVDGAVALEIRNSWGMGWGEDGYGLLKGKKILADDAVAPLVPTAS